MSSIGHKIKGATQFVHGMGDSIRGTALGAVDTATGGGETKNDEIAQRGRLEMQEGLDNMRGIHPASGLPPGLPLRPSVPEKDHGAAHEGQMTQAPGSTNEFPKHHRDDAISNDPDAIGVGRQFANDGGSGIEPAKANLSTENTGFQTGSDGFYHETAGFPVNPEVERRSRPIESDFVPK